MENHPGVEVVFLFVLVNSWNVEASVKYHMKYLMPQKVLGVRVTHQISSPQERRGDVTPESWAHAGICIPFKTIFRHLVVPLLA